MRANTFAGQVVAVLSRRASVFESDSLEPQTFPGRLRALLSRRRAVAQTDASHPRGRISLGHDGPLSMVLGGRRLWSWMGLLLVIAAAAGSVAFVFYGLGVVQTSFMPDFSVVATVISTMGTLLGALGGVALTHRANVRREEAQFRREEAQFNRQRKDQRTQERRQAYADLLGAATQLKAEIEIAGQQYWKDMNVRLATIQQHAVSAGLHASRVALLSPETAEAAPALASAARRLAAAVAKDTDLGYQGEQFLGGQITRPADSTEFDECITRFSAAAAQDRDE